jgi:hypothetical protein
MRGKAARPVSVPTLCPCKTPGWEGRVAWMLLVHTGRLTLDLRDARNQRRSGSAVGGCWAPLASVPWAFALVGRGGQARHLRDRGAVHRSRRAVWGVTRTASRSTPVREDWFERDGCRAPVRVHGVPPLGHEAQRVRLDTLVSFEPRVADRASVPCRQVQAVPVIRGTHPVEVGQRTRLPCTKVIFTAPAKHFA